MEDVQWQRKSPSWDKSLNCPCSDGWGRNFYEFDSKPFKTLTKIVVFPGHLKWSVATKITHNLHKLVQAEVKC